MHRVGAILVAVTALTLGLAATAQGNFVGTGSDPAGDASDPGPGRDIVAASLSYDRRSGELIGAVQLRGSPGTEQAFVTLFAGVRTPTGCDGVPAAGFGAYSDEHGATWKRIDDTTGAGPAGDAEKVTYDDAVTRFEATDSELAGQRFDCVVATLTEPGNAANVYDSTGPIELVAQPALSMRLRGIGRPFKPNRPRGVKITLANAGDATTAPIRLQIGRARGVRVTPAKRSLGALAPGSRRTVGVKLTLTARARAATKLRFTATAGNLVARGKPTLHLRKPSKPGGGGGGTQWCTRWVPDITGMTGGSLIHVPC